MRRPILAFVLLAAGAVLPGCKKPTDTGTTRDFLAGVTHAIVQKKVIQRAPGVADEVTWRRVELRDAGKVHSLLYAVGMQQPLREGCAACEAGYALDLRDGKGRPKGHLSLFCGGRAQATFQIELRPPRGCRSFAIADAKAARALLDSLR